MIEASCHCGDVTFEVDVAPTTVTECNCSLCRRKGVLWAYYARTQVRFTRRGAEVIYAWGARHVEFRHCARCFCLTHWSPVDSKRDRMGVNARLMAPEVLAAARVRRRDGANTRKYEDEEKKAKSARVESRRPGRRPTRGGRRSPRK